MSTEVTISKGEQIRRRHKEYGMLPPKHMVLVDTMKIMRVLANIIEVGVDDFHVYDDRGGTGYWRIYFDGELSKREVRKLVGNGIDIYVEDEV